MIRDSPFEISW